MNLAKFLNNFELQNLNKYIPRSVWEYTSFGGVEHKPLEHPLPPQTTCEQNNSKTNAENFAGLWISICR